mgnify:CR=1 FL=1
MDKKFTVEVRLNNTLFNCVLDGNWYNANDIKAYAIAIATGVIPQQNQVLINLDSKLICENCWKANKDNKEGLNLKEPSRIVTAPANALNNIKKPMN